MAGIFISYRRDDSGEVTERISSALKQRFNHELVFLDVKDMPYAVDFRKVLETKLMEVDVLVAVIGVEWASIQDAKGNRRLCQRSDFVRNEILMAMRRGIQVVPVLVNGAIMPSADEVPRRLRKLTYLNALQIDTQQFDKDVAQLNEFIQRSVLQGESEEAEIAKRARHMRVLDVVPPPFSTILQKLAVNRFFTTVTTLIVRPSLIRRLNVRYLIGPSRFGRG